MNANLLRRVNWLWKHRHTHDDENFQEQITLIKQTVESHNDDIIGRNDVQAHIHLTRTSAQTISVDGEAVTWTGVQSITRIGFADQSLPTAAITIQEPGYYNFAIYFEWDTYGAGGTVRVTRTRDGDEITVYSDQGVDEWTATVGEEFDGVAHAIPCKADDEIRVYVDHNDSVTHDLAKATLAAYLVQSSTAINEAGVTDVAYSEENTSVTSHTVSMTSAQKDGDLLLMFLVSNQYAWSSYPSGWSTLVNNYNFRDPGETYISVLYKESDGTETDVTAETATASESSHIVWVVSSDVDYSTATPDAGTPVRSGTNTIDPPAVTPSHGTGNYLVFPVAAHYRGGPVTDDPDGYTLLKYDGNPADTQLGCGVWKATVTIVTSEDPSSLSVSNATGIEMGASTIAVKI